jgi:LPS-assembly lipoprotein
MRRLLVLLSALLLAGCGFQLRGNYDLPWESIHLGLPPHGEMRAQLKRGIESGSATRVVDSAKEAQASLVVVRDERAKSILSLSAAGLVREFQLTMSFAYRLQDAAGKELAPGGQIVLQREMSFDDQRILAKEQEEQMLWRDMQADLVRQLLRRLAAAKPVAAAPQAKPAQ